MSVTAEEQEKSRILNREGRTRGQKLDVISMEEGQKTFAALLGRSNKALSQDCNYDRIVIRKHAEVASA